MRKVLIPIPSHDFDPTEAAVTWKMLRQDGIDVVFATPDGQSAVADERMLRGTGLGPWVALLRADANGLAAYRAMESSAEFKKPLAWDAIRHRDYDGVALPGGHAPGMRAYLESKTLQNVVAQFSNAGKIIGAICHGVVLVGRSRNPTGQSVLHGKKATALLRTQELGAWALTCLWLGNYYRTYSKTVQAEVTANLGQAKNFVSGPMPLKRDAVDALDHGFVVEDGNLVTARWPGDAHLFGMTLARRVNALKA